MKINNRAQAYPYLQVIILFAGLGSVIAGLIAQAIVLWIFGNANFAQIGYQPFLYVALLGFIPALLTAIVLAYKKIGRGDNKSILISFIAGFVISALYTGLIIIYLGITSWIETGVLLAFMIIVGLFGGVNSIITSSFALPKACKTTFDKVNKKGHDVYQGIH